MKKAAFIDRDGTINEMVYDLDHGTLDSPRRPEHVSLVPGAASFLSGLRELGYLVIVATNQPGIAKGTLTVAELEAVNNRIAELLRKEGAEWDDMRYCPHHPQFGGDCDCRKPKPGMLLDSAKAHGVNLAESWMIGDGIVDIQAGRAAGCRTLLVSKLKLYHVERFLDIKGSEPDAIAGNLAEALAIISGKMQTRRAKE